MSRRVVVTGMGVCTSLGHTLDDFWNSLIAGKSGISRIEGFDASPFPTRIAAEIKDFDPDQYIEKKDSRLMDRFSQLAVAAASKALKDAGLNTHDYERPERIGVIVGSGVGGNNTWEEQIIVLHERGVRQLNPYFIPMMIVNMGSGQVSMFTGAKGPISTTATACASGTNAIGDAFKLIQRGAADVMICGGAEASVSPGGLGGFCALRALSVRNDEPERASRPFDIGRNGFVMGEGSGMLILEEMDHAIARGARIYAEVAGYGMSADAYNMTLPAPEGEGAARCMAEALKDAAMGAEQVQYINAHGTSTPAGDRTETTAIKTVFGSHAHELFISSTKSMTGHLLGAAGAVEAVISVLTLTTGRIAPTINLEEPDPQCDLNYTANAAVERRVDAVLTNSFGFGGFNASLIFKRWNG
ncbi:beta-ketoacyl-ACP synthase II [Paenibacillus oenotherae]|uniref:3-oxoacyl-[acyl-carrier-protein] synthase 2 n=1 Tax=Paenibacillus oenotherae TaxID=1435645 RepID=A0ABS7DBI3_9BACL|nr:beta-ketoacyl-ACP synthase II [Paenibacillus oenotherae]